ncbi:DNA-binding SARP family transcriptional activator [Stackebrandtia endophytica]|uniref:DNA-binding SARP family transcriptional activator n=2 Tax=Stackebrandtia endophytica TaxID=1496996 RepID=A0A543ATG0_9ACTN|nr:DNA-binding SARP family transcriptional activator [Stackebrandtia endophytica]
MLSLEKVRIVMIRLVGRVVVGDNEQHVSAPKLACVLAILASEPGSPIHHFDMIDNIWDSEPPRSAIGILYSYVARLRAMLQRVPGAELRSNRRHYVLDVEPERIDVHRVRLLASKAAAQQSAGNTAAALDLLREANKLAGHEALIGIGGKWAERFRTEFRQTRLNLLAERHALELELGHHRAVLPELTTLVSREPTAERLVEQLMLALYRDGRSTEALDVFTTTRRRLRHRLGADPSPSLQRLHVRMLQQDPSLEVPASPSKVASATPHTQVPAQLPASPRGFSGREEDVSAVVEHAGTAGVVVVDGMAGVGKTALAVHAAHRLANEYPDGQLFIDLRGYADGVPPTTPGQALAQLLRSLDVEVPDNSQDRPAAWRTALAGRRILLVLDNAHVIDQVLPLLPGGSGCATIITSRRKLVHLVDAFPVSLDVMEPDQAAAIFAADTGTDPSSPAVHGIVDACGRLPLALRIAASRLRNRPSWTPDALLNRLLQSRSLIRELDGSGRGIEAAFRLSYQELPEPAQRLFRTLSVFSGREVDPHRAAVLIDGDMTDTESLLEQLVDVHLLISSAPGRYQMHDLLRQYAAALVPEDERRRAWTRLAEFYIASTWQSVKATIPLPVNWPRQLAVSTTSIPAPTDTAEAEAWMRNELPVLERLIIEASDNGFDAHVIDLCLPTQAYLMHHGAVQARLPLAEIGIAATRRLGARPAEARMENFLGIAHEVLGHFDLAENHLLRALELWRRLDDPIGHVTALNNLGMVADRRGQPRDSIMLTHEAIGVARESGATAHLAHLLFNQAGALAVQRRFDESAAHLDECDQVLSGLDNDRLSMWAWSRRGMLLAFSGDPDAAVPWFKRVVDYGQRNGAPDLTQVGLWGLTESLLITGDPTTALPHIYRQLELLEQLNLTVNRAETLCQLGWAQLQLGRLDDAHATLTGAVEASDRIGAKRHLARARRLLGETLLAAGNPAGHGHLRRAMEMYEAAGYPDADDVRETLET